MSVLAPATRIRWKRWYFQTWNTNMAFKENSPEPASSTYASFCSKAFWETPLEERKKTFLVCISVWEQLWLQAGSVRVCDSGTPTKDGMSRETAAACCIIKTHTNTHTHTHRHKPTLGQGCPRNHWNGRNNLHYICCTLSLAHTHTHTHRQMTHARGFTSDHMLIHT